MTTTRSRPPGIPMLCLWSLGLAVEMIVRIGLAALQQLPTQEWTFTLTLPLVVICALCTIALSISCFGLWNMRDWARRLFLVQLTLYYGLLFFGSLALWGPIVGVPIGKPGQGWVTIVVLEGALGLGFGWWYLNRDVVQSWFHPTETMQLAATDSDHRSGEEKWE